MNRFLEATAHSGEGTYGISQQVLYQ